MPILNFSYAIIKDAEAFKEYITKAGALMNDTGVEVLVRGEFAKSILGSKKEPHIVAVFRYPDMATADAVYASPEYAALVPLRNRACDMTIHFYNE